MPTDPGMGQFQDVGGATQLTEYSSDALPLRHLGFVVEHTTDCKTLYLETVNEASEVMLTSRNFVLQLLLVRPPECVCIATCIRGNCVSDWI